MGHLTNRRTVSTLPYCSLCDVAKARVSSPQGQTGTNVLYTRSDAPPSLDAVLRNANGRANNLPLPYRGGVWSILRNAVGKSMWVGRATVLLLILLVLATLAAKPVEAQTTTSGSAWDWGSNRYGQLGDGTYTNRTLPVTAGGLTDVKAVAGGGGHSLALKSDGTVWAWGDNRYGQLGDGTTTTNRSKPVRVSGLTNVVAVAAGQAYSLALTDSGEVYAWGSNLYGQLGDGTTTNRSTPVPVLGVGGIGQGVKAIAAGGHHSLAIMSLTGQGENTVRAWGANNAGQLGDGTTIDRHTPVEVSSTSDVKSVAAGGFHSLAIKYDGTAYAWGNNLDGQLADGTTTNRSTPMQMSGLSGVVKVAAGGYHSLAVKNDGTVWAAGANNAGQLGDGTITNRSTPVRVSGLTGVKEVAAGYFYSLASAPPPPKVFEESNRDAADYGLWSYYKNVSFSGGYSAYSNAKNDSMTFRFTGTSVTWKTNKLPDSGITAVYLDGVKVKTFDGYSSSRLYNVTGYAKTGLANKAHTLKLVVTGTKNAASTGTYTEVDRFLVGSTSFQENHWRIGFGPWGGAASASASGGTYRQSASTTQGAWLYGFTGPYVDVVTQKGPTRGVAKMEVYDAATGTLVKTVKPNLYASTIQWKASVRVTLPDPTKKYTLKVSSSDGKAVVVDAYRAFPSQQQAARASSAEGGDKRSGTKAGG